MNKSFVTETLQNRHSLTLDQFRTLAEGRQKEIFSDLDILLRCRFLKQGEPPRMINGRPLGEHLDALLKSVLWGHSVPPALPQRRWVEPFSPGRARTTRHETPASL